ncbi:MAG TPA: YdcF family protein [Nocardioides sp.]|uniref:YdcF family protein n=1 Tax=uncultured Nocardioides sp. TaxID=198441 RepID=UPI0026398998|nr:YdcF family protein [uncultured Nocardioides sp.]HRD63659.1 YdcF family protein [Nocardioides sp.]HRI96852.1 YdcF family protein [Nocardioides sp.]HRK46692.1 YdcF family protein [Nocardioides sp.]
MLLLFGGSLPDAWDAAARTVAEGRVGTLVLVGGVGHTTDVLRSVVGDDTDRPEADLMAAYVRREHGLTDVLIERDSRNCGENVVLARELVLSAGLAPRTVTLVQEPTMQRRMDAVFRQVWPEAAAVNRPGPRHGRHAWPRDRWISLVMGEVPRLRDDEHGYGPRGHGFQAHVDVPPDVESAYAALVAEHPDWGRPTADPR